MGLSVWARPALACATLAGCSFSIGEPSAPRGAQIHRCTESRTLPVIDLVTGGTFLTAGVGLYALLKIRAPDATDADEVTRIALVSGVIGAVYLVAGMSGLGKTRRCREARAALR